MRRSFRWSVVLCAPVLLAACDGTVVTTGAGGTGGSGGTGAPGGAGGSVTTGGSGGSGGDTTTSTSTDTTTTTSGPGDCPLLSVLTLTDPKFTDDGGDGTWSPGEGAVVTVTMTNPTSTDVNYPGITWFSNEPLVSSPQPNNAFFVIFAGMSMPIDVGFVADATTPTGTQAQLTAKLTDIQNNVCEDLPAAVLDVVLE
jgi:hypothetical protein